MFRKADFVDFVVDADEVIDVLLYISTPEAFSLTVTTKDFVMRFCNAIL